MGHKDAQEHAARVGNWGISESDLNSLSFQLRAIAIIKAKRKEAEQTGGVKRKAPAPEAPEAKRPKASEKMDEIRKMLARKSSHHQEAKQEEGDAIQRHLTGMEEREKVETFTTTCTEVKNVKVVTCKEVGHGTAQAKKNWRKIDNFFRNWVERFRNFRKTSETKLHIMTVFSKKFKNKIHVWKIVSTGFCYPNPCFQCKYTAQFANSECYKKEHKLVKHTADKRFFKCVGCKKRIVCFEMMPVRHCNVSRSS